MVRSTEISSLGSLNPGTIIRCGKKKRCIRYDNIVEDDGVTYCEQVVNVPAVLDGGNVGSSRSYERIIIRPIPPILEIVEHDLQFGLCVDVDYEEAWWEGVIFDHDNEVEERNVFFPDLGDEMKIRIQQLRITQDWDEVSDSWKRRGKWAFLELVEEIASVSYIPVSIKQIYYDVRKRDDFFDRIKDWTCNVKDLWREPVMEILNHYTDLTISEILHVLDLPGCLLEKTPDHESAHNVEADIRIVTKQESIGLKSTTNVESNVEDVCPVMVALSSSVKDVVVKPEICPQAVLKYYLYATKNGMGDKKKWRLKAKKHLLAEGWVVEYPNKSRTRAVYKSPQNHCLKKLKDACRVYLETTIPRWTVAGMRTLNVSSINEEGVESDNIMECVTKILQQDPEFNVRDGVLASKSTPNTRHQHMEMPNLNHFHQKAQNVISQNVISWLIEKNKLVARSKVYYKGNRGRDPAAAEGRITRDGIKCSCCHNIYGINGFASHASRRSDFSPSGNIFLKDGRSLLDCQRQVMYDDRTNDTTGKPSTDFDEDKNDDICSVCRYGGDIILCDKCPSAFHKECIALKIYIGLNELLGKPISVGEDNLTWTLLKLENPKSSDTTNDFFIECYSKLNVAASAMHECFVPQENPFSGRDITLDVKFGRL
ncbi:unnamed protein product [Lupinus luteus]|uniref:Agenet domain-containing protein n=1 Tax=Lupinus luteus TaxID=3873 RepID=A0AAV1XN42_LUPLU